MLPASAWANTTKREVSGTEVSKRVVVVASGVTERTALPSLTRHLASEGIEVDEVLFPRDAGCHVVRFLADCVVGFPHLGNPRTWPSPSRRYTGPTTCDEFTGTT